MVDTYCCGGRDTIGKNFDRERKCFLASSGKLTAVIGLVAEIEEVDIVNLLTAVE